MTEQDKTSNATKRPIALISIDTKTIYERLIKCTVGDVITYETLEKEIGRTVRDKGAWILLSARRKALNENGMLFGTISKVGIKRLNDVEIVDTGQDAVSRIHRISNKGIRKLAAVQDYAGLPEDAKMRQGLYASALGMLSHVTKPKQMKRIEDAVSKSRAALPLQKTLDAFRQS